MSNQGYYANQPQYPPQSYGPPQQGYYNGPPQQGYNQGPPMQYGPPQQQYQAPKEKKSGGDGCFKAWYVGPHLTALIWNSS
ncbi:hypothetical protein GJ744_004676 [Endocarpon pusillum]|uniref:Cysteine-rich transmembrane CYSTM domain-containing protein n=1 Tax=Endocarpon pusillum TaxID=364733 RepID=A0A8H7ANV7_9EURO|nr:hypothetical protein GJ744_004676 [Endocarpon pusillum]